jgi:hypothetical protein
MEKSLPRAISVAARALKWEFARDSYHSVRWLKHIACAKPDLPPRELGKSV